ncbi:ABC transporter permease [Methylovirgula sp. 4M-Z18]|uniref:ABC transporter permease n=1 Tax=Methylovirgula sp. 4M-Z18 TaxID=2293567 RepID=UPI000E2F0D67|nr:ABC transporter permease [Methylovirgula sp. 4M-Z18]RFB80240.1 ABC transporter permease [Methylovirgula sp. 4M-Z18]
MRIDLEPRGARSPLVNALAPIVALIIAMLIGGAIVAMLGKSPVDAFYVYFVEPLTQGWSLQQLAVKASPLVLIALGLAFCYRANLWNIGAEGQLIMGGIFGSLVGIWTNGGAGQEFGSWWIVPSMLVLGALGGLLYAMIPALLRVSLGVSEILTSLMLVYVAQKFLDYLARGPLRDPEGHGFPNSVNFDPEATLPPLYDGATLHVGVIITLILFVIAWLVMSRSLFGFQIRLAGQSPRAARFAGFSDTGVTLMVFAISGAAAGLAGIIEIAGPLGQLKTDISPSTAPYGFAAIIVAFLGRLSPPGIVVAGLVLALTYIGGEGAQAEMQLPFDMTRVFQGVLLMCILSADVFTLYRLRIVPGGVA